jgi:cyclomaltodextrinase
MTRIVTPDWVRDAVFYQIYPDTFARSDRVPKPAHLLPWDALPSRHGYKGGNLLGVVEHLDYLLDLGINAIYFCPIFQSASNHRYHTHDYYRVDPMLGGDSAFRELLDVAHKRGVRIVIDGVFNHASRGFFQFNDILENGLESAYVDWFTILDPGKPLNPYDPQAQAAAETKWPTNYACWWDLPALPEFNTDNSEVRAFLWDVATHWVALGIDGWRLDVPQCINDEAFWQIFRERVKAVNPDAYLVGEIWHSAPEWLQGDRFDAVMNYVLNRAAQCFFGGRSLDTDAKPGGYLLEPIGAEAFAERVDEALSLYAPQVTQVQLNLLGSHDTPRILSILGGDRDALKLCWLFLATVPGAPCIYYGDEVGMTSVPVEGYEGRGTMSWDEAHWDTDLRDTLKRYIALRVAHPALRRGTFATLHASDAESVYAYLRRDDQETIVVILNNGYAAYEPRLPVGNGWEDHTALEDLLGSATLHVRDGHIVGTPIPARSGIVLCAT